MLEIILGIYGAIFGAIMGALIAFLLTKHNIEKTKKNELEKLHNIINDEFYRIYFYTKESIQILTKLLENEEEFQENILNIKYEIMRGRSPILINFPNLRFLLWDAITSSGRLITLETEEIQLTNTTYENIKNTMENVGYEINQFEEVMPYTKENPVQYSDKQIKIRTHMFYGSILAHFRRIQLDFESLDEKIDWIKRKFSSSNSQKINECFDDTNYGFFSMTPWPQEDSKNNKKTAI